MAKNKPILEKLKAYTQNKVVNVDLEIPRRPGCTFSVKRTARKLKHFGAKYNSSRFQALRIKMKNPSGGLHMFDGGSAILTGTKNGLISEYVINSYITELRTTASKNSPKRWTRVKSGSWKQVNVVCSMSLPFCIDLRGVNTALNMSKVTSITSNHRPHRFTGLVAKLMVPKDQKEATALVFDTGSMIITGLSSVDSTRIAARMIAPYLIQNDCGDTPPPKQEHKKTKRTFRKKTDY